MLLKPLLLAITQICFVKAIFEDHTLGILNCLTRTCNNSTREVHQSLINQLNQSWIEHNLDFDGVSSKGQLGAYLITIDSIESACSYHVSYENSTTASGQGLGKKVMTEQQLAQLLNRFSSAGLSRNEDESWYDYCRDGYYATCIAKGCASIWAGVRSNHRSIWLSIVNASQLCYNMADLVTRLENISSPKKCGTQAWTYKDMAGDGVTWYVEVRQHVEEGQCGPKIAKDKTACILANFAKTEIHYGYSTFCVRVGGPGSSAYLFRFMREDWPCVKDMSQIECPEDNGPQNIELCHCAEPISCQGIDGNYNPAPDFKPTQRC